MHAAWSYLKARVGNRLARHLRVAPAKLNNSGPMVSFTFDDAPISTAKVGADTLEQYDARGTFYIAGGLVDVWFIAMTSRRRQALMAVPRNFCATRWMRRCAGTFPP